jgi:hypothetical protein
MQKLRASVFFLSCALWLCPADVASAQERGDIGISMGFPEAVGFMFHVTDRVAVRPELNLTRSTSESDTPIGLRESRTWAVGFGVSGLFYLPDLDKVRMYISPRYAYVHGESDVESTFLFDDESTFTSNSHAFSGSFGAQYAPHERFSIFGEVGLFYNTSKSESSLSPTIGEGHSLSTRTSAGVIFYF